MAFDNEVFPFIPLKHDRRITVVDPVSVVTNGNYEYRVKRQQWERWLIEISAQTMTTAQKETIRQFLMQRQNGKNSFKFEDPEHSSWDDVVLTSAGGSNWYLYLPFGANTSGNTHPMFNQTTTDFTVTVNGGASSITSYQLVNGIPSFTVTGTSPTDIVRLTGTAYFNVRLDSSFSDALYALDCNDNALGHQVASIQLAEVHGES